MKEIQGEIGMKTGLFHTCKNYKVQYLPKDILSGIIMAAVSIPIAMGYAEVAGLPAVYGLYGSVFPILLFAIFSTALTFKIFFYFPIKLRNILSILPYSKHFILFFCFLHCYIM